MNILITTSSFGIESFPEGLNVTVNPHGRRLTEQEVLQLVREVRPTGMIAGLEPLNRKVIEAAAELKVISRCGIGRDNVDAEAAQELGIAVTVTPEAPTASVAELTLGLTLTLIRRIRVLDAGVRRGEWKGDAGRMLAGKTVGVIGCGRIGTYAVRLFGAFGCKLLGYTPSHREHEVCRMTDLDSLLMESDIVTLHLPYRESTRHFIGQRELALMKRDALLINTARGGLIDETALLEALQRGLLGGAALDCFEEEPYAGPLVELDNVTLTPHVGSSAAEARRLMEREALDNMLGELARRGLYGHG